MKSVVDETMDGTVDGMIDGGESEGGEWMG